MYEDDNDTMGDEDLDLTGPTDEPVEDDGLPKEDETETTETEEEPFGDSGDE